MASDTLRLSAIVDISARCDPRPAARYRPDLVGRRLGTYLLAEKVGVGAYASVYRARHELMELDRAIKVLHRPASGWREQRARLAHEARVAASIDHPNVVAVHDCGIEPDGTAYLVMDFVAGRSLAVRLREGRPPLAEALRIGGQVAAALDHAHRDGIVHRDVKPANILLDRSGRARLSDFGIARIRSLAGLGEPGAGPGTPAYMSTEQCRGGIAALDARTDVYSLAAVVYEMLTGRPPLGGGQHAVERHLAGDAPAPASAVNPALPASVDVALAGGLEPDRRRRCPSAGLLLARLTEALAKADGAGVSPGARCEAAAIPGSSTCRLPALPRSGSRPTYSRHGDDWSA